MAFYFSYNILNLNGVHVCICGGKALRPSNELITWVSRSHSEIESCERNSRARFNISLGAVGCEFLAKPPYEAEMYALCRSV